MADESLQRLRTDRIDLFYQHRVDPKVPMADVAGTVKELIAAGKVARFGPLRSRRAHHTPAAPTRCSRLRLCKTNILSGGANRSGEPCSLVEELGIGLVAYSPLGRGYLTGKAIGADAHQFDRTDLRATVSVVSAPAARAANQALLDAVGALAADKGGTPAQVALAWSACPEAPGSSPFRAPPSAIV